MQIKAPLIAGNWKMNLLPAAAATLIKGLANMQTQAEVAIFPPAAMLPLVVDWAGESHLNVGGQNCATQKSGAFTGETSAELLQALGCVYCLVGHSERRQMFNETETETQQKVNLLLSLNLKPILCVGENLLQRESNQQFKIIHSQLTAVYAEQNPPQQQQMTIAYEPLWAIGTGKTASPTQAAEMHHFIRQSLVEFGGAETAKQTRILYGGSVKPENAASLLVEKNIDGLLVGGASLSLDGFSSIIQATASRLRPKK